MDTKTVVDILSRKLDRNKSEITLLLDSLCDVVSERCADYDSVAIPGFGMFEPQKEVEHIVVDSDNGQRRLIPPKVVLEFKPSALLKQKIKKIR